MSFLQEAIGIGEDAVEAPVDIASLKPGFNPWIAAGLAAACSALFAVLSMPSNSHGKAAALGLDDDEYEDWLEEEQLRRIAARSR